MEKAKNLKTDVTDVLKAVLFATLISLAMVLIFAIVIRFANVENKVIMPVNIAIKILSLLIGVAACVQKSAERTCQRRN